jgi:hypothetical protein
MNTRDRHRLESHARRIEELRLWRNARESRIEEWRFSADGGEGKEIRLGDFWPEEALPASFSAEAKIPEDWGVSPSSWSCGSAARVSSGSRRGSAVASTLFTAASP